MLISSFHLLTEGTYDEHKIVNNMITEIAGRLFPYLSYLRNANRNKEAALFLDYRQQLFDHRDSECGDKNKKYEQLRTILNHLREKLTYRQSALRQIENVTWEISLFGNDLINDIILLRDHLNKLKGN